MSVVFDLLEPVRTMQEYTDRLAELARESGPTVFGMRARLPTRGAADMPLAATDSMSIILKTYASGGENTVHAHPYEDHAFVVLQGKAHFFHDEGALATLYKHQGILLPRGAYYRFEAGTEEPLVMLRVGAITEPGRTPNDRVAVDGSAFDGFSEKAVGVEPQYETDAVFE